MNVIIDGVTYVPACAPTTNRICVAISTHTSRYRIQPGAGASTPAFASWRAADYVVGNAYGGQVVYPCWSLVDHANGEPVERHPDGTARTERRRAWRLA